MLEHEHDRRRQGFRKKASSQSPTRRQPEGLLASGRTSGPDKPRLMSVTDNVMLRPRTQERDDRRRQGFRKKASSESPVRRRKGACGTAAEFDESGTLDECYFLAEPGGSNIVDAQAPTSANKTQRGPSPSPRGPIPKTRRSPSPARTHFRPQRVRGDSGVEVLRILFEKCALTRSVFHPIASSLRNGHDAICHNTTQH